MGVCVSKTSTLVSIPEQTATPPLSFVAARTNPEPVAETEIICRKVMPKLHCPSSSSEVTRLITEWKRTNVLSAIQSHVLAVSAMQNDSVERLSSALTQINHLQLLNECGQFELQTAKAYCMYYWIAINVKYDKSAWIDSVSGAKAHPIASTLIHALTEQKAVSEGFSTLFQALASHAGLNAVEIRGYERAGRISGKDSSTNRFIPNKENAHAWNAVS